MFWYDPKDSWDLLDRSPEYSLDRSCWNCDWDCITWLQVCRSLSHSKDTPLLFCQVDHPSTLLRLLLPYLWKMSFHHYLSGWECVCIRTYHLSGTTLLEWSTYRQGFSPLGKCADTHSCHLSYTTRSASAHRQCAYASFHPLSDSKTQWLLRSD